jgi:small subunit ribosomal protein S19e
MSVLSESGTEKLIEKAAEKLKSMSEFKPPEWSTFVKTGSHKERPPQSDDWWWIRAAAVLRKIRQQGNLGVAKLRKEYGGRKNRGHRPERKYKASGSVMRKVLQQLESAGFVAKNKNKGRMITQKGIAFLNEAAKAAEKAKGGSK